MAGCRDEEWRNGSPTPLLDRLQIHLLHLLHRLHRVHLHYLHLPRLSYEEDCCIECMSEHVSDVSHRCVVVL